MTSRQRFRSLAVVALLALAAAGCGDDGEEGAGDAPTSTTTVATAPTATSVLTADEDEPPDPVVPPEPTDPTDDRTGLGEPTDPATVPGYGADPTFDALARNCFDGALAECDELFRATPRSSGLQAYGSTCGGRLDEPRAGRCEAPGDTTAGGLGGPAQDPEDVIGGSYGDNPAFDRLARSCREGALRACDRLYAETPLGSGYETYGATCGGRTDRRLDGTCTQVRR